MPDELLTNAGNKLLESGGPWAAAALLMALAMGWMVKMWRDDAKACKAEMKAMAEASAARLDREIEEHQETREKWLNDVKVYAGIGETMRADQKSAILLGQQTLELVKDLMKEKARR